MLGLLLVAVLLSISLRQVPARADAPIANPDSDSTDEDTPFTTVNVLDNDTDSDPGDVLSVIGIDTTGTTGQVTDKGDGKFDYDPDGQFEYLSVGQSAEDTFTYTVSDGQGGTDTATVTITIAGLNDDPTAANDGGAGFTINEDTAFVTTNVLDNDTDPDASDTLFVTGIDTIGTLGQVIDNGNGTFGYDPDGQFELLPAGQAAEDTFSYTVGDGHGGSDTATVRITVQGVNDPPVAVDDTGSTNEDTILNVSALGVLGNDTDVEGHLLNVTAYDSDSAQGATVVVDANGGYIYNPTGAAALQALAAGESIVDTFRYTVGDGNGGRATATVRVTVQGVNDWPTAYDDWGTGYTTDEDTPFTTVNVLINDEDPDANDSLIVIVVGITGLSGQLTYNGDGTFDYDPNAQFEALGTGEWRIETFTYTISDGNGGSDTATVSIVVNGVNDAPVATDNGFLVQEDSTGNLLYPLVDDSDVEGDSLTIVNASPPMSGTVKLVAGNTALAYTPDPDFYGLDSFTYTISDGNGGSDMATINVQVVNVNDDPTAEGDLADIDEDSGANILYVLANDTYLPDPVEALNIASASPAAHGNVSIALDGSYLSYTPDPDYYGPDAFTYTIVDDNGGSATAEVNVDVINVNDDPQADDDWATVDEDSKNVKIDVLDNDTYLPDPPETLTIVAKTDGAYGDVRIAGGGTHLEYTPDKNYYGRDELTYTIDDGYGGKATGTVVITVKNVNDPPLARRDTVEVNEDSGPNPIEVLANDTYLPDPPETLAVVGYSSSQHGTVIIVDGGARLTYRPDDDFYGTDAFAYTISDGNGKYATASVDVTVLGINDPPNLENDSATTQEDTPVTIDVLKNDDDIDGKLVPSTVSVTSGPSHGSTSVDTSNGKVTYVPALNWNGYDSFTYRVCDDGTPLPSQCDTATVDISVGSVNDPPICDAGPDQRVDTNSLVTLDGSGSTDPDDDYPLTYLWSQTGGPTVTLSSATAEKPTFIAPDDPCGLTFALLVIDSKGRADNTPDETVVTVLNQLPIADAGSDQMAIFNSLVTLDGSGSTDLDNDPLTYLWSQIGGPTVKLSDKFAVTPTFTPPARATVLTFTLSVTDAFNGSDPTPDEVVINVNYAYLTIATNRYAVAPDLVIQSLTAGSNGVQLVIANQGNAPVRSEFWVDVYINPWTAPARVNETWLDLADEGLVWAVTEQALAGLTPGGSLTLSIGDPYYQPGLSAVSWPLRPGTPVYAQVDSYNPSTTYGTVLETHELLGGAYNNIRGPVSSTASATAKTMPSTIRQEPVSAGDLPARP